MKRIIFNFSLICFLFGDNINVYTFSIQEDYEEIAQGSVIDKDSNNFGDMYGIGISYEKNFQNLIFSLDGEYSSGTKRYTGAYWNGTPVEFKVNNSYLYNIEGGVDFSGYFLKLGYRFWNRGNSDTPGDYNEQYYWSYIASGMNYRFLINKIFIKTVFQYQYALNPKLKLYLGNEPTLNLGTTSGYSAKFDIGYKFKKTQTIGFFYKYDFWHISASNDYELILNNQKYMIFEPESYTRNQYLGIFYKFNF